MSSDQLTIPARDYDLAATLSSGQSFRWSLHDRGWDGVVGNRWVRLQAGQGSITARAAQPVSDWNWLSAYLQTDSSLARVLATFPSDPPMSAAIQACHGLRLLRQDPWECLASFLLSSTKQIVQIRQIVAQLCECFGEPVPTPVGHPRAFAFPSSTRLARATESELRACKMGFRAAYLLNTARRVAGGDIDLDRLRHMPVESARTELMDLPGVGRKIADCVLLFAYGFQTAFPIDVWILKALRQLYFPGRRPAPRQLRHFSETHFGPNAGYAQQYLFHYMRTRPKT